MELPYKYIKGKENPLSCDSAFLEINGKVYIFEAGNSERIIDEYKKFDKDIVLIISHFHADHLTGFNKIKYKELYVGEHTLKYTHDGIGVNDDVTLEKNIKLFKIPSCHAKGTIGMTINEYTFIGDALAPTFKNGNYVYNVQLLKEEIDLFESLDVKYFVSSHSMDKPKEKEEVINKLKEIYNKKQIGNPYIIQN